MNALIGGVETPYQVVAITKQLLNHRVLPAAISYLARYTEDNAVLVAPSIEAAAPDARRNIIDNWFIPQPEPARLTRRSFVEAGLADLNGPEIEGYGKLIGHGWLLKQFTPEAMSVTPLSPAMATCKAILDRGDILLGCQLDRWTQPSVRLIFEQRNARDIAEVSF
ncbi:MAG TPA: hypothetical protein VK457_21660 [Chloroflexota bacterium]|jgi:hypothetical protein|nr:hypothetical protein [Chloroflexota bacterium]